PQPPAAAPPPFASRMDPDFASPAEPDFGLPAVAAAPEATMPEVTAPQDLPPDAPPVEPPPAAADHPESDAPAAWGALEDPLASGAAPEPPQEPHPTTDRIIAEPPRTAE